MTYEEIQSELNRPLFSTKDVDLTYRAINHYEEKKIILTKRKDNTSWRKYTAIEVVWLNLVSSLREMGLSLMAIQRLYTRLFIDGKFGNIDKANFINKSFEDEILESIIYKKELYILIFSDSTYTFHDSASLAQWHDGIYKNEPHINVPLTGFIKEVMAKV